MHSAVGTRIDMWLVNIALNLVQCNVDLTKDCLLRRQRSKADLEKHEVDEVQQQFRSMEPEEVVTGFDGVDLLKL